jgi:hypothetical protein
MKGGRQSMGPGGGRMTLGFKKMSLWLLPKSIRMTQRKECTSR